MSALSSYVAANDPLSREDIEGAKQFMFDADGIRMVNELSMHNWRDYEDMAELPFDRVWLEWSPDDYLPKGGGPGYAVITPDSSVAPFLPGSNARKHPLDGPQTKRGDERRIERVGMLAMRRPLDVVMPVSDNDGDEILARGPVFTIPKDGWGALFYFLFKREAVPMPWAITHKQAGEGYSCDPEFLNYAWGEPWVRAYSIPNKTCAYLRSDYMEHPDKVEFMVKEFAGVPRIGLAAIAMLNAHREKQEYPENYKAGRTIGRKSNTIPAYKPSVIHLRPDAVRFVMERAEREPTGRRVREHDRKGHWRQLPGRKVWVRDCKPGKNNGLGRVESTYVVEKASPTIPDEEGTQK